MSEPEIKADLDRLRADIRHQGAQAGDAAGPGQARARAPADRDQPPRRQHLGARDRRGASQGRAGREPERAARAGADGGRPAAEGRGPAGRGQAAAVQPRPRDRRAGRRAPSATRRRWRRPRRSTRSRPPRSSASTPRSTTRAAASRRPASEDEPEGEVALRAEAEALRTKTREQAALIDRLQRRLGRATRHGGRHGAAPAAAWRWRRARTGAEPGGAPAREPGGGRADAAGGARGRAGRARRPAGATGARGAGAQGARRGPGRRDRPPQGGTGRLRAGGGRPGGLRNSRLALKARAGSAEAQAERQAATIAKLRAELAAATSGWPSRPPTSWTRCGASARARRPLGAGPPRQAGTGSAAGWPSAWLRSSAAGNGKATAGGDAKACPTVPPRHSRRASPPRGRLPSGAPAASSPGLGQNAPQAGAKGRPGPPPPPAAPAAAEMPQTAAIPGERRKMRLLDRITGLGKA